MRTLHTDYTDMIDQLATTEAQLDALRRELADEQARNVTLQRRIDSLTAVVDTGDESDVAKRAMLHNLRTNRAAIVAQINDDLPQWLWLDEMIAAAVNQVAGRNAPDSRFEDVCQQVESRVQWTAQVNLMIDGQVVFRVLSDAVSFAE